MREVGGEGRAAREAQAGLGLAARDTILYVHYVDLLMWSPQKLDFPFYDFSLTYCDFLKIQPK
jgi:hypothetical protein